MIFMSVQEIKQGYKPEGPYMSISIEGITGVHRMHPLPTPGIGVINVTGYGDFMYRHLRNEDGIAIYEVTKKAE